MLFLLRGGMVENCGDDDKQQSKKLHFLSREEMIEARANQFRSQIEERVCREARQGVKYPGSHTPVRCSNYTVGKTVSRCPHPSDCKFSPVNPDPKVQEWLNIRMRVDEIVARDSANV